MKHITLLLIVALSSTAYAETVKKWVDEHGRVHYGNSNAVSGAETVEIKDTFDEKAYREGVQRHEETEKILDQLEQELLAEEERLNEEKKKNSRSSGFNRRLSDEQEQLRKRKFGGYGYELPPPSPLLTP